MEVTWNFSEAQRLPMTWHQSMGSKGAVVRPRCMGTERDPFQLLLYSSLA